MRFATYVDEPVETIVDRFVGLVWDGRGDLARGRNLFLLRFLDALWQPGGPLELPYRPTRNPGAFVAMAFDLVGDERHGYLAALDGAAATTEDVVARVRRHTAARLAARWPCFVQELHDHGLPNLARVVEETIAGSLHRPSVSDFPQHLSELQTWMTVEQSARFDAHAYARDLPIHQVLRLLRHDTLANGAGREQHPSGGDLRSALRRRLDAAWSAAIAEIPTDDHRGFLGSFPADLEWLAEDQDEADDFAVSYAIATDAASPGRTWSGPAPYVDAAEHERFLDLIGRGQAASWTRRTNRLRRWGVSATLPASVAAVDEGLEQRADALTRLHARAPWRAAVAAESDAHQVARRHFLQRVADRIGAGREASE